MYFPKNLKNFGIILKGSSVSRLPQISNKFNHCFMVNNFDRNIDNKKELGNDRIVNTISAINKYQYSTVFLSI